MGLETFCIFLVDYFLIIILNSVNLTEEVAVKCECQQCGYKWKSRIKQPKACPKCKRYDWAKRQEASCQ